MTRNDVNAHDEAHIRAVLDARASAMRSKNVQGVLSVFADDAVGFFLETPLQMSPREQDLAGWFASWVGPIGYEMRAPDIRSSGDVAFCHMLSRMTGERTDGEETDLWFRETLCLRRTDDRWLVTHVHESVPLYMDGTVRAAFDLHPPIVTDRLEADTRLLRAAYAAFNARDIDAALALMTVDVCWPKAFKGGFVRGHEEVRGYWTEQWSEIDPHVVPVAFYPQGPGQVVVDVHQVVRSLAGSVLADARVGHAFVVEQGLIRAMEVCSLPSSGTGA